MIRVVYFFMDLFNFAPPRFTIAVRVYIDSVKFLVDSDRKKVCWMPQGKGGLVFNDTDKSQSSKKHECVLYAVLALTSRCC